MNIWGHRGIFLKFYVKSGTSAFDCKAAEAGDVMHAGRKENTVWHTNKIAACSASWSSTTPNGARAKATPVSSRCHCLFG